MSRPIRRVLSLSGHPSRPYVAARLERPTRVLGRAALVRTLFGLAPGGVYRAAPVTGGAGGLLHHRFTLAHACSWWSGSWAVCSLWHCPAGHPGWLLATTLPCGARTFLGGDPRITDATAWPTHPRTTLPAPTSATVTSAAGAQLTARRAG